MRKYSKLSDKELKKLAKEINAELSNRQQKSEIVRAKKLNINGITAKDICVLYGVMEYGYFGHHDSMVRYQFYVKHGGRIYDFYYDHSKWDENHNRSFHPWWPIRTDDEVGSVNSNLLDDCEMNGATEFVPPD